MVVARRLGEGRPVGLERKMKEVRMDVTVSEHERPGLLRSSMYHNAGFASARVRVSWRVDCQGRRRCCIVSTPVYLGRSGSWTYNGKSDPSEGGHASNYVVNLLADRGVGVFFLLLLERVRVWNGGAISTPY